MKRSCTALCFAVLTAVVAVMPVAASAQTTPTIQVAISPIEATVQPGGSVDLAATFTLVDSPDSPPAPLEIGIIGKSGIFGLSAPESWTVTPDVSDCHFSLNPHSGGCVWQPAKVGSTAEVHFAWASASFTPPGNEAEICASVGTTEACSTVTTVAPTIASVVVPDAIPTVPRFTG